MELYEILYTMPAGEIEPGDLIRFPYQDEDDVDYTETVHVDDVDYVNDYVLATGFSEVQNAFMTFWISEEAFVEVLGG